MEPVNEYLNYIRYERRYSPHTIVSYQKDLKDYIQVLEKEKVGILQAKRVHARLFIATMAQNLCAKSINRKIKVIRKFYNYCQNNGFTKTNPFYGLPLLKEKKHFPEYFYSPEDVVKVITSINPKKNIERWRHLIIFELLYCTGIRVSELCSIKITDVDLKKSTIKVLGKGNKERLIIIIEPLQKVLRTYLRVIKRKEGYLIDTSRMGKTNPMYIHRTIKKYFPAVISCHSFRHSFATHLLEAGAPIQAIKELMGHSSLLATSFYLNHNKQGLKTAYDLAHPKS